MNAGLLAKLDSDNKAGHVMCKLKLVMNLSRQVKLLLVLVGYRNIVHDRWGKVNTDLLFCSAQDLSLRRGNVNKAAKVAEVSSLILDWGA